MAKGRSFNPLLKTYPDSEKVNAVPIGAESLYTRLIAKSDDAGRYWGEPMMVMAKLFTHRMQALQVNELVVSEWIEALASVGLIRRYSVNGRTYLVMVDVYKSLKTDRPTLIEYPSPDDGKWLDPERNQSGTVAVPQPNPTQPNPTKGNCCAISPPSGATAPAAKAVKVSWSPSAGWGGVTEDHKTRWAKAYPACVIDRQLAAADAWMRANPQKARRSNYERFFTNWLSRSQDRGGDVKSNGVVKHKPSIPTVEAERYLQQMLTEHQGGTPRLSSAQIFITRRLTAEQQNEPSIKAIFERFKMPVGAAREYE